MKYRTETRHRDVEHTIDGRTATVSEAYTVQVPVPPRDWDRIVLAGVSAATVLVAAASVAWSTASIGDLLARAVAAPIAYLAAGVFDLAWITCMATEWLARYDERRARLPRLAGHFALLVAMLAVGAHGYLAGSLAVGIVGALVSALAKGMWTVVLRHNAKPLDERTSQWVQAQLAEAGARLAMVPVKRQLARAEGLAAAEQLALGNAAPPVVEAVQVPPEEPDASPADEPAHHDAHHDAPQISAPIDGVRTMSKTAAIRAAASLLGDDAKPSAIVDFVREQHGLDLDENYVRTVRSRDSRKQEGGYL